MRTTKAFFLAILIIPSMSAMAELQSYYSGCIAYHWALSTTYEKGSTLYERHTKKMREVLSAGIADGYDKDEMLKKAVDGLNSMKTMSSKKMSDTSEGMEIMCRKLGKL